MGDITCSAPRSSCLAHSVSKPCSLNLGDWSLSHCWVDRGTGKARRSGCLTRTQQLPSESFLCSAVTCWLCQWPLTSLQAPAHRFQLCLAFLAEPMRTKQQLIFSVMCSPWLHLFLLLFPTAGVPWQWAVILNRGEHHGNNRTPKQPMKLPSLQDTFPQTANTGHQSSSSEPGFAFLT